MGPQYRGPTDQASLLFAVVSGRSSAKPDISNIPRYQNVATYPPATVWNLADNLYGLTNGDDNVLSLYPPYVHVALQPPSSIEQVAAAVTETNVDNFMDQFGMLLPTEDTPQSQKDKMAFFMKQIAQYDPIFKRAQNLPPPPVLAGKTKQQARTILAPYTLKEIVDAYEPVGTWTKRNRLIDIILEEGRGGSQWSWRRRYCNNDNTFNVMQLENHGDIDKNDPTNPTLSYGVQKNYRCYQVDELEASFREDTEDNIFHFRVPDYKPANAKLGEKEMIDPTTGAPLTRDFPIESIRQLRTLLQNPPPRYDIGQLAVKVNDGLNAANNANVLMRRLKGEYDAKPDDQKYIIRLYLAWLFVFGMWMRFWRGPGNRWPTQWVEGGGGGDRCETGRRDEYVFIQQSIRTAISDAYEKMPGLKAWIETLPLLDYNFTTGEAQVATAGTSTIVTVLNRIQLGDFCMAHGSDLILKTSYYLIARILNFTTGVQFNGFIDEMLPALLNIEGQVVNYQLAVLAKQNVKTGARKQALEARQADLARPTPKQPPFDPTAIGGTGHTDPQLGYEIRFGDNN